MVPLQSADLMQTAFDALILPVCEDQDIHANPTVLNAIQVAKAINEFTGKKDEEIILYHPPEIKADRIICLGMGAVGDIDSESFRSFAGKSVKLAIKKQLKNILIAAPDFVILKSDPQRHLTALMEGALLANHVFDTYKKDTSQKPLEQVGIFVDPQIAEQFGHISSRVSTICKSTLMAREWVSMPPNRKTPRQLAQAIKEAAHETELKITILDEQQLQQKKMGALLAVAAGSKNHPAMVIMEYTPPEAQKVIAPKTVAPKTVAPKTIAPRTIALIGKGVTFDSGGINLKTTDSISDMKMDMAGAAAVAATMIAISALHVKERVIGLIPLVENMPSGSATRPGDIITSFSGKTIEIGNTDAEGRLILIDAITYALKHYQADTIIDIATLTGACIVALGEQYAGLFSLNEDLAKAILQAGIDTHEQCWRLPLPEEYKELLKSDFADIKNIGKSRWGGAITAALFLSEFIEESAWAHIDIAGPAFAKKARAYCDIGGTGFGVRLFCNLLERIAS